jgi:hypothetical protein
LAGSAANDARLNSDSWLYRPFLSDRAFSKINADGVGMNGQTAPSDISLGAHSFIILLQ